MISILRLADVAVADVAPPYLPSCMYCSVIPMLHLITGYAGWYSSMVIDLGESAVQNPLSTEPTQYKTHSVKTNLVQSLPTHNCFRASSFLGILIKLILHKMNNKVGR